MSTTTSDGSIRVGAVDDHSVVLSGVAAELAATSPDIELVAIASTVSDLLATGARPDVVLLDLELHDGRDPDKNVADLIGAGCGVLVFTGAPKQVPIVRCIGAGALGLLLKADPISVVAEAIRTAHAGDMAVSGPLAEKLIASDVDSLLTERQVEILALIAEGLPRKSVARRLGVAVSTVNEHVNRIADAFRERGLDSTNAHALIRQARADGYLQD